MDAMKGLWLVVVAFPLSAHIMSMSTGELLVEGGRAHYELRLPIYEVAHIREPEASIFQNLHFYSRGTEARLLRKACREDLAAQAYSCNADYEFAGPVDELEVKCTFYAVTVPTHVHLLRLQKGDKTNHAVFDFSFTKATIRFEPPAPLEIAVTQIGAGFRRSISGAAQILFLVALVLAARSRRELFTLTAMFLLGEILSCLLTLELGWQVSPRFVEASMALTMAYLATEILLLPEAGLRWLVVGVLGACHGLYFELFLLGSEYRPAPVLAGVALGDILSIALLAFLLARINRIVAAIRLVQVSAVSLLVIGIVWFWLGLR